LFKIKLLKVHNSLSNFNPIKKTIVTIGTFDGVHIGHKKILKKVVAESKKGNCESVVLTFFPHPRMVLQQNSDIKLLNTIEEKTELIENIGIDNLIIHPFNKEFSELSAEEFIKKILIDKLNIQKIIIGYDHRFGKNRAANFDDLKLFGKKYNFEVEEIKVKEINQIAISSTKIRNAIVDGNISLANKYLDYNYTLSGIVVKGNQLGRTIGFPTANIKINESYKLIPKNGVYIVNAIIDKALVFGMMNIGNRPTINGQHQTIEVNFLNFNKILYNKKISVNILKKIREEKKFQSIEALKKQLEKDQKTTSIFVTNF
jgi:riboflavin kinase/FMN adenylyltransferase